MLNPRFGISSHSPQQYKPKIYSTHQAKAYWKEHFPKVEAKVLPTQTHTQMSYRAMGIRMGGDIPWLVQGTPIQTPTETSYSARRLSVTPILLQGILTQCSTGEINHPSLRSTDRRRVGEFHYLLRKVGAKVLPTQTHTQMSDRATGI